MQDLLVHPAIQSVAAPALAALVAALLLRPLKLGGLAITAGFAAAVYLIAGFEFSSLSTTRKIILVGLLAPVVGIALDLMVKTGRNAALWPYGVSRFRRTVERVRVEDYHVD